MPSVKIRTIELTISKVLIDVGKETLETLRNIRDITSDDRVRKMADDCIGGCEKKFNLVSGNYKIEED